MQRSLQTFLLFDALCFVWIEHPDLVALNVVQNAVSYEPFYLEKLTLDLPETEKTCYFQQSFSSSQWNFKFNKLGHSCCM